MTARTVDELVLAEASGVWVVRSASRTEYFVDADNMLLLRRTGPASSSGPGDNRWCPLVLVESVNGRDRGVIRVGDRHVYTFDDEPDGANYHWWIQRLVMSIDWVEGEELAALSDIAPDGAL